jgi:hypothetical protein
MKQFKPILISCLTASSLIFTCHADSADSSKTRTAYLNCLHGVRVNSWDYGVSPDGMAAVVPPTKSRNYPLVFFADGAYRVSDDHAKSSRVGSGKETLIHLLRQGPGIKGEDSGYTLQLNNTPNGLLLFMDQSSGAPSSNAMSISEGSPRVIESAGDQDAVLKNLVTASVTARMKTFNDEVKANPDAQYLGVLVDNAWNSFKECDGADMDPQIKQSAEAQMAAVLKAGAGLPNLPGQQTPGSATGDGATGVTKVPGVAQ